MALQMSAHRPDGGASLPRSSARRLSPARRLLALGEGRKLDAKLAAGADPDQDPMLAHRAARLTTSRSRRALAAAVRNLVARSERPQGLSAAAPLARANVLHERARLTQLADRLDGDRPVDARGVAATRLLLTDGTSPLYAGGDLRELAEAVETALNGLEI